MLETQRCESAGRKVWGETGEREGRKNRKEEHLAVIPNTDGYGAKADGVSDWLLSPMLCDRYKVIAELQMTQWDRKEATCRVYLKWARPLFTAGRPASPLNKKSCDELAGRWDTGSNTSAFWKLAADGQRFLWPIISADLPGNKKRFMDVKYKKPNDMWHQVWWCDTSTSHVHLSAFHVADRADRLKVLSRIFIGPHSACRRCFRKWLWQSSGIYSSCKCCIHVSTHVSLSSWVQFVNISFRHKLNGQTEAKCFQLSEHP